MKHSRVTDEQKQNLEQYGYEVVEEVEVGGYDLVLTHFPLLGAYHLALQKQGQDFSSPEQQMTKIPGGISADMTQAIPVIDKWIKKYKELWISGNNPAKVPVYKKILQRLGYQTDEMDMFGITMLSIDKPSSRSKAMTSGLLKKAVSSLMTKFEDSKAWVDEHLKLDHLSDQVDKKFHDNDNLSAKYYLGKECFLTMTVFSDDDVFFMIEQDGKLLWKLGFELDELEGRVSVIEEALAKFVKEAPEEAPVGMDSPEDKAYLHSMGIRSKLLKKADTPEEIFEELGTGELKIYNKSITQRVDHPTRNPIYQ